MSGSRPAVAPVEREPAPAPPPRRRRRRWPIVLVAVLLVLAALVVVAALVADRVVRDRAEREIERQVAANLPDGVTGRVAADVDGAWVLPQLAAGEFDHVTLVSHGLRVQGAPAAATVQLYGVPVEGGTIGQATADLRVGQAAFRDIPALTRVHASDPVFGDGTVSTTVTQQFLGVPLRIRVVLQPRTADQTVLLDPVDATLTAGPASVPATAIVQQLLPDGVTVCAASYLPKDVTMTYLRPRRGSVTVGLSAFQVDLDRLGSGERGSCG